MPAPQSYITHTLPWSLARAVAASTLFQDVTNIYDFALGGIPFLSEISAETPLIRGSAQFKKDQFDNGLEPGEQSLSGWWLRSQSSWHLGTGIVNLDVRLDPTAEFRYADSEGVNPWIQGSMTLLKGVTQLDTGGSSVRCLGVQVGGDDYVLYADDDDLFLIDGSGTPAAITWGGSGQIFSIATDGENWFALSTDGIYTGSLSGSSGSKLWSVAAATHGVVAWLKGRLVAGIDNSVYELIPGSDPAPHTLPTPSFTHPASGFQWHDLTEGPEAIYAVGHGGTESIILKLTLDTNGLLPELTAATTAAELPRGELAYSIYTYLGNFMAIGTSRGCRIAQISTGGDLAYGPLIETPEPVEDFVGVGDHIWAGYSDGFSDGSSGLIRISLRDQMESGRYPYAKDLKCPDTGRVMGVTTLGASGRLVFAVAGSGLFVENQDDYVESGWFVTGRIRYNTLWPKLFKFYNLKAVLDGPIAVATIDTSGNEVQLASVDSNNLTASDLAINFPSGPQEFISLKFTLGRSPDDSTSAPVLRGFQVKALPGGPRPRQYIVPLRCYDHEMGRDGSRTGYEGWALERLQLMEELDSSGDVVIFEDLASGTATPVTIETVEFRQMVPPGNNSQGWGGTLTVVLRTLS